MLYNDIPFIGFKFNNKLFIRRLAVYTFEDRYEDRPYTDILNDMYVGQYEMYNKLLAWLKCISGADHIDYFFPIVEVKSVILLKDLDRLPSFQYKNGHDKMILNKTEVVDQIIRTPRYYVTLSNMFMGYNWLHSPIEFSNFF